MTDVLLINPISKGMETNPSVYNKVVFHEPTGLLCLGSYLEREGFNVKIIDCWYRHVLGENYLNIIKKEVKDASVVGFSVMTTQIKSALEISEIAKNINEDVPTVFGGVHPTIFPSQTCEDPLVDFAVFGEGEGTFLELVKRLDGDNNEFDEVRGLAFKKDSTVKINEPRKFLDMDTLPPPNWELLEVKHYIKRPDGSRELQVHTSRGCPHRCAFCINYLTGNRKWRAKSPKKVVEEIGFLVDTYGIESVRFNEENFACNVKRVDRIAEGLRKEKIDIRWRMNTRADYFKPNLISAERLKNWEGAGLCHIFMGVESGSDRILRLLNKDITVNQIIDTAKILNKFEIIGNFSFMVGLPTETKSDMYMTVKLIMKIKEINPKFEIIGLQIFRPYPAGKLYDMAKDFGFKEPKSLRDWVDLDLLYATGYYSLEKMPWIKDRDYVYFLSQNTRYIANSTCQLLTKQGTNIPKSTIHSVYGLIQKVRWKTKFFNFPYEKVIFQRLGKALR